ncbi:MAG: response regulator [Azospirillum brasilense]|nr:MAG: response regulator [Azospirillum brasilense]
MSGAAGRLRDRRILVAEDEYMFADDLAEALVEAGAIVAGPVARVGEALELARSGERLDGAVLDVNLAGEMVWPVADVLAACGVPVLLVTGYDAEAIPAAHAHRPRCEKPVDAKAILSALARTIG